MKKNRNFRLEIPIECRHWAYRINNVGTQAQIRRHIEENQIPGWEEVSRGVESGLVDHKIMKFEKTIDFQGKQYKVLFLENWFYEEDGAVFQVDNLWSELEG